MLFKILRNGAKAAQYFFFPRSQKRKYSRYWSTTERRATEGFIEENFTSISLDQAVARIAAEIRRSTKVKFPDAAIAATALFTHTPLVTRNQRDFKHIPGLNVITI